MWANNNGEKVGVISGNTSVTYFGHVSVSFRQFKLGSSEFEIHRILRSCSRGEDMSIDMTHRIGQLNGTDCYNLGKEQCIDLRNETLLIR